MENDPKDAGIVHASNSQGPVITKHNPEGYENPAPSQSQEQAYPSEMPEPMRYADPNVVNPAPTPPVNPLLQKVQMPGKVFKLPSGGYMYKNGEISPQVKGGEVHVRPMSALAEIKMKNPDMLFSGKAIEEVFGECIPEIHKPLELYGRDVDALMCFLRLVTYGPEYDIEANHGCENGKDHTYTIDLQKVISTIKELDPTQIGQKYTVSMENGQVVEISPLRFKDIIELLQPEDDTSVPSAESIQQNLVTQLLSMIESVDGITDKGMISEWIRSVPATYITKIGDALEKSNDWGPSFEQAVQCPDCGEVFSVEIPVNPISFFSE